MSAPLVPAEAPDQLRRARECISTPERWAQGTFAAVDGEKIGHKAIHDPGACLCVNGALLFAIQRPGWCAHQVTGASLCLSLAARARGFETASKFNDAPTTTHADVLALLDEAIALAESMLTVPS